MLAGNPPIDLRARSTAAMAEPTGGGAVPFLASVTQAMGSLGFCEGCGRNLSIFTLLSDSYCLHCLV